eukprot:TRINITY_DN13939_c0_g1_i2.p1 TRINITY_DN13939_c0_g1~~TRINITY_DN13939_c0_g1_i2.p1  ORF type:complete len:88 (+),score=8.22 TRINITY_DN13939_c0_g1_i2:98-361(+)
MHTIHFHKGRNVDFLWSLKKFTSVFLKYSHIRIQIRKETPIASVVSNSFVCSFEVSSSEPPVKHFFDILYSFKPLSNFGKFFLHNLT